MRSFPSSVSPLEIEMVCLSNSGANPTEARAIGSQLVNPNVGSCPLAPAVREHSMANAHRPLRRFLPSLSSAPTPESAPSPSRPSSPEASNDSPPHVRPSEHARLPKAFPFAHRPLSVFITYFRARLTQPETGHKRQRTPPAFFSNLIRRT